MFQKKSFNLIAEEDIQKKENSKKFGLMKCLMVPAIICFTLTMILMNVDFSKNVLKKSTEEDALTTYIPDDTVKTELIPNYNEVDSSASTQTATNSGEISEATTDIASMNATESNGVHIQRSAEPHTRFGDICTEKANPCTLSCSGSNDEKALNKRLEDQYKKCQNDMELTIQGLIIRTLGKDFLSGNFRLKKLAIFNCFVDTIENNAFNKATLQNLQKLIIADSSITKLNCLTFDGLASLEHFEMVIKETSTPLDAKDFLVPMAKTLTRLIFKQSSTIKEYDPTPWLDGFIDGFIALTDVDLSDNNFANSLHQKTFSKLVGVKNLNLKNCRMEHFAEKTFLKVKDTLQKLDLSQNEFKTLNADFLFSMSGTGIVISITGNPWDCSCHSEEFVGNIQHMQIHLEQEPKCSSPPHLSGIMIKNVICCEPNDECRDKSTTTSMYETTIVNDTSTSLATHNPVSKLPEDTEKSNNIEVVCKSWGNGSSSLTSIERQYVAYKISSVSATSVLIELKALNEQFQLLYYRPKYSEAMTSFNITDKLAHITDLIAHQDYLFCAMPPAQTQTFSPLNCHSHRTGMNSNYNMDPWLNKSHKPLLITLGTFGGVIFFIIGIVIIFLTLRWRPTLLKGSKRLFHFDTDCKQVFLSKENADLSAAELYDALRTYATFYNTPMQTLTNNDYLQYIRGMDSSPSAIYSSINLAPVERAPAKPPNGNKRPISEQSTIPAHDDISLESIGDIADEHEYQCLDQYQQISLYGINPAYEVE